jgi:hypothetical protein
MHQAKNKMKSKMLAVGLSVITAALLMGTGMASAQSFNGFVGGNGSLDPSVQAALYQYEAQTLGLNPSVISSGITDGQNLAEIAYTNGIAQADFTNDLDLLNTNFPGSLGGLGFSQPEVQEALVYWQSQYNNCQGVDPWNNVGVGINYGYGNYGNFGGFGFGGNNWGGDRNFRRTWDPGRHNGGRGR